MRDFMAITKSLSDRNRVRVLMFLRGGELCVCQLIEMLGLAPSTVSKHMSILYQAGLVETRKEGRWTYYRLSDNPSPIIQGALGWIEKSLSRESQIVADAKLARRVCKIDKEKLCARYSRS